MTLGVGSIGQLALTEDDVGSASSSKPFFPIDWPNPRTATPSIALRTWAFTVYPGLRKDKFFGAADQPTANLDWPVPKGDAPRTVALRTWAQAVNLNLLSKDQFFGLCGNPNFDWPVPATAQRTVALRTWAQEINKNLISQDRFFGVAGNPNLDWPIPKGHAGRSADLRTWVRAVNTNLISKDQFFGLAGSPTFDWPVPAGTIPVRSLRTWTDPLKLNLQGKDAFFGAAGQPPANLDWPNPRGAKRVAETWLQSFTAQLQAQFIPPTNYDWPNPRGSIPGIKLRTWTDPVKLNLAGKDTFFSAPGVGPKYDYPNPRGSARASQLGTWLQAFTLQLQAQLDALGSPHSQFDWPNPKGATRAVSLRTWTDPVRLNLAGKDQFFTVPGAGPRYEYLNPRAARRDQVVTWMQNVQIQLIAETTPPEVSEWIIRARRRGRR